ncbi:MAG TPA: hypothetical protein VF241_05865 [Propionibacteriaceae bacterium]
MGVEALAGLNQSGAGNLDQVLLVFAAMHKPPGERFSQPEMGRHHLSNDPLSLHRARRLGSNEKIMSVGRKLLPGDLMARKSERSFGDRHERVTLREEMRAWRASWPQQDTTTEFSVGGNPLTIQKTKKSLRNAIESTLSFLPLTSQCPLNAAARLSDVDQESHD